MEDARLSTSPTLTVPDLAIVHAGMKAISGLLEIFQRLVHLGFVRPPLIRLGSTARSKPARTESVPASIRFNSPVLLIADSRLCRRGHTDTGEREHSREDDVT